MKKKIIIIIIAFTAVLLLAAAALAAWIFYSASHYGNAQSGNTVSTENTPLLGKRFELKTDCFIPYGQQLAGSVFTPGTGFVQAGEITVTNQKRSLRGTLKTVSVPVKAYRNGTLAPGKLSLEIERPYFKNGPRRQQLQKEFSTLEIKLRNFSDNKTLPLADAVAPERKKSNRSFIITAIVSLLILSLVIYLLIYFWRRKKHPVQLSPQAEALQELAKLRETVLHKQQPLAWCVARLSDIVRKYLSRRFNWRTTRQTTEEFFMSLKFDQSALTTQQREYLTEFLNAADLVKFANIKPDTNDFMPALANAEKLIMETSEDTAKKSRHSRQEAAQC